MLRKASYVILAFFLTSCSTTDSDSHSNVIRGTVENSKGEPVQDARVGVIYKFTNKEADYSLFNFPNPFSHATTIQYEIKSSTTYTLKVLNLETSNEITLINEEKEPGLYSTLWNPSEDDLENGLYKLTDNLENESIIFYAPVISINEGSETMNIAGQTIGDFLTTSDKNGNFEFNKDEIISTEKAFILTNEQGLERGSKTFKKEVYIVAYTEGENYDLELINYEEQNSTINLSL